MTNRQSEQNPIPEYYKFAELTIRHEYLEMIDAGTKTLEVRPKFSKVAGLQPGELLILESSKKRILVKIKAIREYKTIEEVLESENASSILPGSNKKALRELWNEAFPISDKPICVLEIEKTDSLK